MTKYSFKPQRYSVHELLYKIKKKGGDNYFIPIFDYQQEKQFESLKEQLFQLEKEEYIYIDNPYFSENKPLSVLLRIRGIELIERKTDAVYSRRLTIVGIIFSAIAAIIGLLAYFFK